MAASFWLQAGLTISLLKAGKVKVVGLGRDLGDGLLSAHSALTIRASCHVTSCLMEKAKRQGDKVFHRVAHRNRNIPSTMQWEKIHPRTLADNLNTLVEDLGVTQNPKMQESYSNPGTWAQWATVLSWFVLQHCPKNCFDCLCITMAQVSGGSRFHWFQVLAWVDGNSRHYHAPFCGCF